MKKTERLLCGLMMLVMLITSMGLLFASLYASGGGAHSTFSAVIFDKETGIRYNNLTGEFEVFNDAGVSWIASGRYISIDGTVASYGAANPDQSGKTYALADENQIYNVMRDIAYISGQKSQDIYNTAFDTNKITLGATGVIDGRGFALKNFIIKSVDIESVGNKSIGSALVAVNNGTIRNLSMSNAAFKSGDVGESAALICGVNNGLIDNCTTYGTDMNNTYETNAYTSLFGIAAMSGGRIANSANNADMNNSATANAFSAGIAGAIKNARFLNNCNNGAITVANGRASGIAIDSSQVSLEVHGNVNNGDLQGSISVSGIIDGGQNLLNMVAKGNINNGNLSSLGNLYPLYYGLESEANVFVPQIPSFGIVWSDGIGENGGFSIFNADGISWISSGAFFDKNGEKQASGDGGAMAATGSSYYEINPNVKLIDYDEKSADYNVSVPDSRFNDDFYGGTFGNAPSILTGGTFNGNNCKLINFPLRQCGSGTTILDYYSTLFYENWGKIENIKAEINANITSSSGSKYAGGIVGKFTTDTTIVSSITNISLSGTINFAGVGYEYLGGVVGEIAGNLYNSRDLMDVSIKMSLSGAYCIGGVVGRVSANTNLQRATVDVLISGGDYCGGIVGHSSSGFTLSNCSVAGSISGSSAGYLIGWHHIGWVGQDIKQGTFTVTAEVDGGNAPECPSKQCGYYSSMYV